ncbi:MAG: DNA polymerase III subunit alpha [Candidatus Neomarinimicrobiota bacterium]|nr:DNA polymerase III subunit alpha [Candidatus Neomarinimicrobiota bacterium]
MFIHLNTHSVYSPMRGLLSLSDLVDLSRSYGMDTLALTDVNGMWGFIRFVQHCLDAEINPIAGVNLITEKNKAVLLAENQYGYENICRAVSAVHDDPSLSVADIVKYRATGLFVLSHEAHTLKSLKTIIPNTHLFVELRPGIQETPTQNLGKELKLELVATGDVYFRLQSDHAAHITLRAIEKNTTLKQLDPMECKSDQHWFRNEAEMVKLFPNSLNALNNSRYLADRCKRDWSFINTIFPGLSLKETHESNKKLKDKVFSGAQKRYGEIDKNVRCRIEYELDIITQKGFAPYFLIVQDIVMQTRATIGRGSAAASIVSYCLFITQVDPLRYTLQFDRFIHPEREDMPDIDVDFPWDERDSILEYVFKKYGKERTAMVSSQIFLEPRSAVREVGKVHGLSNEEIKNITKRIGWYASRRDLEHWVRTDQRFANVDLDETLIRVLRESEKIVGVFRYPSVHPGGVVIVPDKIRKYVPVLVTPKGVQIVEWEKDQVEDSGLLKIDLLGNRSLAVVRDTIRQVNLNYGEAASQSKYVDYHRIQPVGDEKTKTLMKAGKTMGVFYIESPATRQLLAKAGVVDFEHVVIYSSVIRPAANRFTNIMLARIHGKDWELIHPDLHFLAESYGIMVYEEQVSMAAMTMAGLRYTEAEALRKTMSRDSMQHLVLFWKKKVTEGALRQGYSSNIVKEVWDMIESFIGYSFCKPHSASYAMLSFTCAYLKAHFTAEFLAAVISNQGGFYSSYAYMSEARRFGVHILPPDVNRSHREWRGGKKKIRMGLMSIKRLQKKAVDSILDERKAGEFDSLNDFLSRVDLDFTDAMTLTNAGCFKSLASELTHRELAYRVAGFYLQNGDREPLTASPVNYELTAEDQYRLELETFGYPLSVHPVARYRPMLSRRIKYARDIPKFIGQSIYLIGVYITHKETATRKSNPMEFLTLEDETDIYECVLFPEVFHKFGDMLHWETLFIIRGSVEESFGVYSVTIEKMGSLHKWVRRLNRVSRSLSPDK